MITPSHQRRHRLLKTSGWSDFAPAQALRSGVMGDTVEDIAGRLRKLAVELVRSNKAADAAAVLVGIGAVEMLSMFAGESGPSGPKPQASQPPGY
jgi:hypothetical protein